MRRLSAATLALVLLTSPMIADARPGGGMSMGSRGSHTWSPPPRTQIAPNWARPMDRTATPQGGFTNRPVQTPPFYANRSMGGSYASRHPFLTGFAGGMLGAGLFGMLSGHGFFGGLYGGVSVFGFLLQVMIIGFLIAFLIRRFSRGRTTTTRMNSGGTAPVQVTAQDTQEFRTLLINIQAAWSARDMRTLANLATPEMVGYFNEQLSDLASRGARNVVTDVQLHRGDISEAWREGSVTYATVALQYSMFDITTDSFGTVIDGSNTERTTVTELWTFLRADGRGNWVLSAIQQAG